MVADGLLAHHNKGACNVAAWVPSLLVWGWDNSTASLRHDEHDNCTPHWEGIQLKQTIQKMLYLTEPGPLIQFYISNVDKFNVQLINR